MSEQRLKITLADIKAARATIAGHVVRTPMLPAPPLSALTGADVYVKYENLQVTNSFKERGACVKLAALGEDERRRGVIAMSAGNHAQAVAYHSRRLLGVKRTSRGHDPMSAFDPKLTLLRDTIVGWQIRLE
jgi:threonine dehydratase